MDALLSDAAARPPTGVRHASEAPVGPMASGGLPFAPCALCGGPLPTRRSGIPRVGSRYCSGVCRHAATRERRAIARHELLIAVAELHCASERVAQLLADLGLNPKSPRSKPVLSNIETKEPTCE